MLLVRRKNHRGRDHLNQAATLWNAAERAARAASVTVSRTCGCRTDQAGSAAAGLGRACAATGATNVAADGSAAAARRRANPAVDIAAVVSAYARAIESRDVAAVRRAYPGITPAQAKGWEQFFPTLRSLRVTISISGLDVNGSNADAKLVGAYDYVTDRRQTEHQPVSFQASFRREGTAWQLVSVH